MKAKFLSSLKYILFLAIGIGILLLLVIHQGEDQIKKFYELETSSSDVVKKYHQNELVFSLSQELKQAYSKQNLSLKEREVIDQKQDKLIALFTWQDKVSLSWSKISKDFGKSNYKWVFISMLLGLISHWVRAIRWKLLIQSLGYQPRSVTTFFAVMIGYVANLILPRMGEVSRCAAMSKSDHIPADKLIGTVIVERAVDVISLLFLALLVFILEIDVFLGFFDAVDAQKGMNIFKTRNLVIVLIIILFIVLGLKYGLKIIMNILKETNYYFKFVRIIVGLRSGLKSVTQLKNRKQFLFYTFLLWFLYLLMLYAIFPSFGPTNHLNPLAALSGMVVGSFGMVAPVQGGIGAYHWCLQKCLELYGISSNDGLTLAFIAHTAQTLLIIVLGVLAVMLIPIFTKKNEANG